MAIDEKPCQWVIGDICMLTNGLGGAVVCRIAAPGLGEVSTGVQVAWQVPLLETCSWIVHPEVRPRICYSHRSEIGLFVRRDRMKAWVSDRISSPIAPPIRPLAVAATDHGRRAPGSGGRRESGYAKRQPGPWGCVPRRSPAAALTDGRSPGPFTPEATAAA